MRDSTARSDAPGVTTTMGSFSLKTPRSRTPQSRSYSATSRPGRVRITPQVLAQTMSLRARGMSSSLELMARDCGTDISASFELGPSLRGPRTGRRSGLVSLGLNSMSSQTNPKCGTRITHHQRVGCVVVDRHGLLSLQRCQQRDSVHVVYSACMEAVRERALSSSRLTTGPSFV